MRDNPEGSELDSAVDTVSAGISLFVSWVLPLFRHKLNAVLHNVITKLMI